jgi:hypothetical protein
MTRENTAINVGSGQDDWRRHAHLRLNSPLSAQAVRSAHTAGDDRAQG